jgi:predicted transcriptional regulator
MNRITRAAERVERIEPQLKAAREELHAAMREAHAEGVDVATITRLSGLSRQRVSLLLRAK